MRGNAEGVRIDEDCGQLAVGGEPGRGVKIVGSVTCQDRRGEIVSEESELEYPVNNS